MRFQQYGKIVLENAKNIPWMLRHFHERACVAMHEVANAGSLVRTLEKNLQGELDLARGSGSVGLGDGRLGLSEGSGIGDCIAGGVRIYELNPIGDVIYLGSKLYIDPLGDSGVLQQREIRVVVGWAGESVSAQSAGPAKGLNGESGDGGTGLVSGRAGLDVGIAHQVRTVGKAGVLRVAAAVNVEGMAALKSRQAGQLPTSQNAVSETMIEVRVTFSERKLRDEVDNRPVPQIEVRTAAVFMQVERVSGNVP